MSRRGRPDDLPAMAALSAKTMTPEGFSLERSAGQIEFGLVRRGELAALSRPGLIALEWLVAEEAGRVAAYVIATRRARGLVIEDCGDEDPGGARVPGLVAALVAQPSFHPPIVHGWLPESFRHWTRTALWRAATDDLMMLKPLGAAPRPTLRGPVSYLESRSVLSGRPHPAARRPRRRVQRALRLRGDGPRNRSSVRSRFALSRIAPTPNRPGGAKGACRRPFGARARNAPSLGLDFMLARIGPLLVGAAHAARRSRTVSAADACGARSRRPNRSAAMCAG